MEVAGHSDGYGELSEAPGGDEVGEERAHRTIPDTGATKPGAQTNLGQIQVAHGGKSKIQLFAMMQLLFDLISSHWFASFSF